MSNGLETFEQFMAHREQAASAYVNGDPAPVADIATETSPATFFGPGGGSESGPANVNATYENGSRQFEAGGESTFEILQMAADGGIAYWTGFQKASVLMKEKGEKAVMNLRVTELFRREAGEWKLVHRHADMNAESVSENA